MLIRTTYAPTVAQRQLAAHGIVARMTTAGVDVHTGDAARAAQILSRAKKPTADTESTDDSEVERLKHRCKELEEENKKLRKGKKSSETDGGEGKKALRATRRNLARAQALRASGELNGKERNEIDEIIRQCNEILEGEVSDSNRSPGPHALGSLASLPPAFRNIIERPRNQGKAHVDMTGISLDVDFDPATAAEMLAEMEQGR